MKSLLLEVFGAIEVSMMQVYILKIQSYDSRFILVVLWETIHIVMTCLSKPEQIGIILMELMSSCIFPLYFLVILKV